MSQLQSAVARLNNLLAPVTEYTNGPKVWLPVAGDPQELLKSELINKAQVVLAAGEAALSGNAPQEFPAFGRAERDAIDQHLSGDAEEHSYNKLASLSEDILLALSRLAT